MNRNKTLSKKPPSEPIESFQYDLFGKFICNDTHEVSNTIEVWESIPKYFLTAKKMEKLRTADGYAASYKWEYQYKGIPCAVKITPAAIEQEDGSEKSFFPSTTEELVEEALKKIFSQQQFSIHDPQNTESWVRFSLSMIEKELRKRNRTRDRNQIKHAIEVMSSCILTFYKEGKEVWKGAILQDLVTVGREEYLSNTEAHHIARLPLFISHSINQLEFRQFNYGRLMNCDSPLSRWIYRRLINSFTNANQMNTYHIMYSTIQTNSGLLQQSREIDNRRKVLAALNELKKQGAIARYVTEDRKDGRKIIDVKYTITPSSDFIVEQKAANKRAKNNQETASLKEQEDRLLRSRSCV